MKWYYAQGGKQKGPVSEKQLKELVRNGDLEPQDLVWLEGLQEWQAAKRLVWLNFDVKDKIR